MGGGGGIELWPSLTDLFFCTCWYGEGSEQGSEEGTREGKKREEYKVSGRKATIAKHMHLAAPHLQLPSSQISCDILIEEQLDYDQYPCTQEMQKKKKKKNEYDLPT